MLLSIELGHGSNLLVHLLPYLGVELVLVGHVLGMLCASLSNLQVIQVLLVLLDVIPFGGKFISLFLLHELLALLVDVVPVACLFLLFLLLSTIVGFSCGPGDINFRHLLVGK